ncbi:MAG TPA: MlaD family protein [Dongiaceae bacterium]|jgi:ABC-type transporter Mla subunit MlaD|nr:MlaD family protein [Dongiaceae bacterium]
MALQDLTPQLRTRLSRMERAVGWFVFLATALLVFGFGYYVYHTAERKGWFTPKFKYQTSLNNASGLKVGDPVKLMGFTAGAITKIEPNAPDDWYGVTISFTILKPHYGYIWDDSKVKVSSDLLGNRFLEITKGKFGVPTIEETTNQVPEAMLRSRAIHEARKKAVADITQANADLDRTNRAKFDWLVTDELKRQVAADPKLYYTNLTAVYWIAPEESPALNERLERVADEIETALPNILNLTNKIAAVLDNATVLTSNLNVVAVNSQPAIRKIDDLAAELKSLTAQLHGPGTLGDWLIPTNLNYQLGGVLTNANSSLATVDTNLPAVLEGITRSLDNLAEITSNLKAQVQANTNMLGSLSKAVIDTDDLVQGLKHHWLFRSAFKKKDD